jgi:dTDP-4-amino-4,6-dideoxygalactose transaminase
MAQRIPLVDLERQNRPLRGDILAAVARCLDRQSFILGEEVERFERDVASYCEVPHAVGVSSGTDALLVALMALGIGPGDEVLTSPFSFFATAGVVSRLGATPAFADIDERTFNLDPSLLEAKISPRTKALAPVHLYGQSADLEPMLELAKRRSLRLVEDAAQAIGARSRDGRRVGSLGDVGAFSFYPSKNLSAIGDAGLVVTADASLAEALRRLRVHGSTKTYFHEEVGGNFRIDAIQSAVLAVKLPHLDEWTFRRKERARRYDELFDGMSGVRAPEARFDHVYHQYVIRVEKRDELREHLAADGIATAVYYPVPLHLQPCFRSLGYGPGDFPVAEKAAKESLALPMFPDLTEEEQCAVASSVQRFLRA